MPHYNFCLRKHGKRLGPINIEWQKADDPKEVFRNELVVAFEYFGRYILKKRGNIGLGGAHTIITLQSSK